MEEQFRNFGPATNVVSAGDVTSNGYIAHQIVINQGGTTNNFNGTNIVPPTLEPSAVSFKNIPEPHGSFVGRVEYITSAIEYLCRPVVADVQIQFPWLIIHALGGYGKTQTARKIASLCRKERKFQHFIWIDSEDNLSVKKSFVEVMIQVGLKATVNTDSSNFDSVMHQFYNLVASRNHEKFLIIFDNVEDFDDILKFLPLNRSASNLAVLMTSQRSFTRESYGHIENQPLDLMLKEEATQLVENILGTSTVDSEEDKKLLIERSGRIALVLCVMTSTVKFQRRYKPNYKIKDYLDEMGDRPIQYRDKSKQLDLDYDKCLQKIVRFAVDKLNVSVPIGRIAAKIFDRLVYYPSSIFFNSSFVLKNFRDICEEAENVDMQLPIEQVDYKQVARMAIEKLSEFSLAQLDNFDLTVHRWIQASRRLDLKTSGSCRAVLKKLLFRKDFRLWVPEIDVWEHIITDDPELINEFYTEKRSLMKFPVEDVDALEKVIRILSQREDFQPFENYDEDIERIIWYHTFDIPLVFDAVKRVVNLFNYDMSKYSEKFMSYAISEAHSELFEWLVDEKSFIPNAKHLRQCVSSSAFKGLVNILTKLRQLDIEITEKTSSGSEFDRSSLLRQPYISDRIFWFEYMIYDLDDSDPLKIHLHNLIEQNYGKELLEEVLRINTRKEDYDFRYNSSSQMFQIMRIILSALKKLEPNIESDEMSEMYSENNLLECIFFCGLAHFTKSSSEWRDLQREAFENNSTVIGTIDTPLLIAVKADVCDGITFLLENYSGDVNVVDDFGETALSYAIKLCRASICKCLLSYKARTSWKKQNGASVQALHIAVKTFRDLQGSEPDEIIYAIVTSKDCDVCAVDDLGNNILHLLVRNYYATRYKPSNNTLQFILSACPNLVDMQNNEGFTPLKLAISLRDKFSHNHWHRASLQSFISMIESIAMDTN